MSAQDSKDTGHPIGLRISLVSVGVCFVAFSVWRIIFRGLLETPSFDVDHFDAGAGDGGLLLQIGLGFFTFVLAVSWLIFGIGDMRFALILAGLAPVLLFVTTRGLQRFAPGYTDKAFESLGSLHLKGRLLAESDIRASLGEPLMHRSRRGGQHWMYSYMPSCGFGWDKKHVFFDEAGRVTQIYTMSEP